MKFNIRDITDDEVLFTDPVGNTRGTEIPLKTAYIGEWNAALSNVVLDRPDGQSFTEFNEDYNTAEFKDDLKAVADETVKEIRRIFKTGGDEKSAFDKKRIDTEKYAYLFETDGGEISARCYEKVWLDKYLEDAKDGVTLRYFDNGVLREFTIPNGGKIIMHDPYESEDRERRCFYAGPCHIQVGFEIYHVDEFAERCDTAGLTIRPAPDNPARRPAEHKREEKNR